MTTQPTDSDPDIPDAAGRTDLGEGTPDPTGPIRTGHEGGANVAQGEDTGPIVAGRQAHETEQAFHEHESDNEPTGEKQQSAEERRPGPLVAGGTAGSDQDGGT